jgi:hypothetical protein
MRQEDMESIITRKVSGLGGGTGQGELSPPGGHRSQSTRLQGQTLVAKATGMSCNMVHVGLRELEHTADALTGNHQRVRRSGGGCKRRIEHNPLLVTHLDALVEPTSRGDPQWSLRWTCKSTRQPVAAWQ